MRTVLFAAVLCFVPLWCLAGPVESSWRVRVPEAGGASYGSGTAIGERFVITNAHVSPRCSKTPNCQIIKPQTGESFECQTVSVDPARDLALLYVAVDGVKLDYIELAETSQTTTVVNYGYGGDGVLASGSGKALGTSEQQSGVGVYSFAVGLRSGDSGGGVFNQSSELVAVQWGTDGQRGVSTAVEDVRTFLVAFTENTGFGGPWCPDGRCAPRRPQGGIGSGRPMIPVQPQQPQNPPIQNPPPTTPAKGCDCDLEAFKAEILVLIDQRIQQAISNLSDNGNAIVRIENSDNVPGGLVLHYEDGTTEIHQLKPIHPQWIANDNSVIDSIPGGVHLGQTMPLRLEARIIDAINAQITEALNARTQSQ